MYFVTAWAGVSWLRVSLIGSIIVIIIMEMLKKLKSILKFRATIDKIPGPPAANFLIGNIPSKVLRMMLSCSAREASEFYTSQIQSVLGHTFIHQDEPIFRLWLGQQPVICVWKPEVVETVLSDNTLLEKSYHYDFLRPWLGDGLLTSPGRIWRPRRKMLVPAFHFHILKDFVPVFDAKAKLLVKRINNLMIQSRGSSHVLDITPVITACALDAICETIMGVSIDAQTNPKHDYCKSVYIVGETFLERIIQPRYWLEPIFKLTKLGKNYRHHLDKLHAFTRKVIADRKIESLENKRQVNGPSRRRRVSFEDQILQEQGEQQVNEGQVHKPKAFLDLLLDHLNSEGGQSLTDEEIREEVDTFMFEGHDTTAMALSWALFMLGHNNDVQNRLREEIDTFFDTQQMSEGDTTTGPIVMLEQIKTLKYLDCVIKESLRLCPSVPFIGRETRRDMQLHGYDVPAGSVIFVLIYQLHRNKHIWPDPERFDPSRFADGSTTNRRHPFAYVPFSAGPRNCIGQKFAMAEMKTILMYLIRNFTFESVTGLDKARLQMEMVLRPKSELNIRVTPRCLP